jgi:hypothetical protein
MRFARLLGYINTTILLTVVFFLFITPIGAVMRLIKRTFLISDARSVSQWIPLQDEHDPRKPF